MLATVQNLCKLCWQQSSKVCTHIGLLPRLQLSFTQSRTVFAECVLQIQGTATIMVGLFATLRVCCWVGSIHRQSWVNHLIKYSQQSLMLYSINVKDRASNCRHNYWAKLRNNLENGIWHWASVCICRMSFSYASRMYHRDCLHTHCTSLCKMSFGGLLTPDSQHFQVGVQTTKHRATNLLAKHTYMAMSGVCESVVSIVNNYCCQKLSEPCGRH